MFIGLRLTLRNQRFFISFSQPCRKELKHSEKRSPLSPTPAHGHVLSSNSPDLPPSSCPPDDLRLLLLSHSHFQPLPPALQSPDISAHLHTCSQFSHQPCSQPICLSVCKLLHWLSSFLTVVSFTLGLFIKLISEHYAALLRDKLPISVSHNSPITVFKG